MTKPPTDFLIAARGLTRIYAGQKPVTALAGVDLDVPAGQRVAVMGASGSGKSTLLHLLGGLDHASGGTLRIAGQALETLDDAELTRYRREKVGFIFQFFNLLPTLSAYHNVALPLELARRPAAEIAARSREALRTVGLEERADHLPDELSGGQRQRVAIARALVMKPPLLLADEPTGNLDSATSKEILELLQLLNHEFGTTLVMVTHDAVAAGFCHRVVRLQDGKIVGDELNGGN
jgi:putative ABC transport system ATP-binding protein